MDTNLPEIDQSACKKRKMAFDNCKYGKTLGSKQFLKLQILTVSSNIYIQLHDNSDTYISDNCFNMSKYANINSIDVYIYTQLHNKINLNKPYLRQNAV